MNNMARKEGLTERQLNNRIKKQLDEIESHKGQKPVKSITINIEWKKSRVWGNNPCAYADVCYKDGSHTRSKDYRASGCGYDKESTVIAECFNEFLRYKLYQKHIWKDSINGEKVNHPYGVYYYNGAEGQKHDQGYISTPTYNGGVGTSCYYKISEFVGGKFEKLASGKT